MSNSFHLCTNYGMFWGLLQQYNHSTYSSLWQHIGEDHVMYMYNKMIAKSSDFFSKQAQPNSER